MGIGGRCGADGLFRFFVAGIKFQNEGGTAVHHVEIPHCHVSDNGWPGATNHNLGNIIFFSDYVQDPADVDIDRLQHSNVIAYNLIENSNTGFKTKSDQQLVRDHTGQDMEAKDRGIPICPGSRSLPTSALVMTTTARGSTRWRPFSTPQTLQRPTGPDWFLSCRSCSDWLHLGGSKSSQCLFAENIWIRTEPPRIIETIHLDGDPGRKAQAWTESYRSKNRLWG